MLEIGCPVAALRRHVAQPVLGFETLTMAPLDRALINVASMNTGERAWVDDYHALVRERIRHLLPAAEREWFDNATAALASLPL